MAFYIGCPRRRAEELSTGEGKREENGWPPKRHPFDLPVELPKKKSPPGVKRLFGGRRAPIGYGKFSVERQLIYQSGQAAKTKRICSCYATG
jgi:hypothetical protein